MLFEKLKEQAKYLKWINDWERCFKEIKKQIEAINKAANLIIKKTDDIGKKMLLNEEAAAKLPLKELNEGTADKRPFKLSKEINLLKVKKKNKALELTDEQLKVINDAAGDDDTNNDDGITWK